MRHYTIDNDGEHSRVHLRVDGDGRGFLLINASRVLHLNPSAARMARLALEQTSETQAVRELQRAYHAPAAHLAEDYRQFCAQLRELVRPDGACPIHELELDIEAPFSARPSAPYRMDLALTYRCNNDCAHCYNQRSAVGGQPSAVSDQPSAVGGHELRDELTTTEWKTILDRLWAIGIPHIVFTGGEPTLRNDLPELIAHAQNLGQITGLNTNARRLSDAGFVQALVEAGLDHAQITVESHNPDIHDRMVAARGAWKQTIAGLRNALATRLFVMTNTTMLAENSPTLAQTLDFLAETGVPTVGLNALIHSGRGATVGSGLPETALPPLLELAKTKTASHGQKLIWYTPTEYCSFDPVALDLGVKGCTAALYNMCIEPDGAALPCQSYYRPVGNLLHDPWEQIWNHELCVRLRERQYIQQKCHDCALLPECGGGCPLRDEG